MLDEIKTKVEKTTELEEEIMMIMMIRVMIVEEMVEDVLIIEKAGIMTMTNGSADAENPIAETWIQTLLHTLQVSMELTNRTQTSHIRRTIFRLDLLLDTLITQAIKITHQGNHSQ
jgi:hypothetical protein